ncbi:unnamed protein product [Rhizophagus irregularis]|nr:unnamed protein product [Rhizophagus irregularis]
MLDNKEIQVANNSKEWIKEVISKKHIKYYEYIQFHNIEKIGNGNFGKVYRAKWKNSEQYMILKSFYNFDNAIVKEIIREFELQNEIGFHNNIIRLYGITNKESKNGQLKYLLVMEESYIRICIPSDVYSIGVLLWEISSGRPPFNDKLYDNNLITQILLGYRETVVPDTPTDYFNIYTECWDSDPDNRPTMSQK